MRSRHAAIPTLSRFVRTNGQHRRPSATFRSGPPESVEILHSQDGSQRFTASGATLCSRTCHPSPPCPSPACTSPGGFWAERLATNRTSTIPTALAKCEESGRLYNFERAAAALRGEPPEDVRPPGYPFDDTDVYKVAEGAAYALALQWLRPAGWWP
jgi:hypothetical protein